MFFRIFIELFVGASSLQGAACAAVQICTVQQMAAQTQLKAHTVPTHQTHNEETQPKTNLQND